MAARLQDYYAVLFIGNDGKNVYYTSMWQFFMHVWILVVWSFILRIDRLLLVSNVPLFVTRSIHTKQCTGPLFCAPSFTAEFVIGLALQYQ